MTVLISPAPLVRLRKALNKYSGDSLLVAKRKREYDVFGHHLYTLSSFLQANEGCYCNFTISIKSVIQSKYVQ